MRKKGEGNWCNKQKHLLREEIEVNPFHLQSLLTDVHKDDRNHGAYPYPLKIRRFFQRKFFSSS